MLEQDTATGVEGGEEVLVRSEREIISVDDDDEGCESDRTSHAVWCQYSPSKHMSHSVTNQSPLLTSHISLTADKGGQELGQRVNNPAGGPGQGQQILFMARTTHSSIKTSCRAAREFMDY